MLCGQGQITGDERPGAYDVEFPIWQFDNDTQSDFLYSVIIAKIAKRRCWWQIVKHFKREA